MKKTINTLKFAAILLLMAGMMISCGKDNEKENVSLKGTKWKLVEFVQVSEGTTKIPEPQSDQCYWITFESNTTFSGKTSTNAIYVHYRINLSTSTIYIDNISGTEINELFDGKLYMECLYLVNYFEVTETSLMLYYNKTDYLLFRSI
ncbi:MAG: hypothetical protein LBJ63_01545 [Prevotellaceae bacterium]|jgi:hypothetical protein|nr:hypothetical protein [Prevotellaceae bacterium]